MEQDEYMENICDRIRAGEPVGYLDVIAAINYQEQRQAWLKANTRWAKFKRWFKHLLKP